MMKLLCIGDIALTHQQLSEWTWSPPGDTKPGDECKVLFNWELPIGTMLNSTPRSHNAPRILSDPASIHVIRNWAPGFAALATNHILDSGSDGLVKTIQSLRQAGFETFGAGITREEVTRPLFWETSEGRLAIVNWVFSETHPDWMSVPGPNCFPGVEEAKAVIQKLKKKADWVMVLAHWSDELFQYPRPEDREIAASLANAGADLIVAHHPHVVRGMETFASCPVFYSLGNFFFPGFVDNNGEWVNRAAPRNREALGIQITFTHGVKPEFKALSFWQTDTHCIADLSHRAAKRLKDYSIPLRCYSGDAYKPWYLLKRRRFDRFWVRWYFSLPRMGFHGAMRYAAEKLRMLFHASGPS